MSERREVTQASTLKPDTTSSSRTATEPIVLPRPGISRRKALGLIGAGLLSLTGLGVGAGVVLGRDSEQSQANSRTSNSPEVPTQSPSVGGTGTQGEENENNQNHENEGPQPYESTNDFRYLGNPAVPGIMTIPGSERFVTPIPHTNPGLDSEYFALIGEILDKPRERNGYIVLPVGINDSRQHPAQIEVVLGRPDDLIPIAAMRFPNISTTNFWQGWPAGVDFDSYESQIPLAKDFMDKKILKPHHQYPFVVYTDYDALEYSPYLATVEEHVSHFQQTNKDVLNTLKRGHADQARNLQVYSQFFLIPKSLQI